MRSLPRNFSKLPFVQKLFLLEISAECHQPKGHWGVGLQTHSRTGFLDLSLKTSPRGWHGTWFYCENHEPSLPLFIGRLPEFQGTWSEEPTPLKLPQVAALTNKINLLKEKRLDESLRGHTLADSQSQTAEEASSSWLGVQRIPGPDLGIPGKDNSGAPAKTLGRNVLGHFQLAIR
jgi:hypothetical protein